MDDEPVPWHVELWAMVLHDPTPPCAIVATLVGFPAMWLASAGVIPYEMLFGRVEASPAVFGFMVALSVFLTLWMQFSKPY